MNSINILFSLLQFLLFCICCFYIIRKYIPVIRQKHHEELLRQKNLNERCNELKKTLTHVDSICEKEAFECDILLNKVVVWKNCFEKQRNKEEEICKQFFQQAQEKYQQQMQLRESQRMQRDLFPLALDKARIVLQQKLLEPHNARAYITECIDRLETKRGS